MTEISSVAIKVQMIAFEPMTLSSYNKIIGKKSDSDDNKDIIGYCVHDTESGLKWLSKETFEKNYFILTENYKITKDEVIRFIKHFDTFDFDEKTTLVTSETVTGFKLNEFSSCVNKQIYDRKIGQKIAFQRIVDKLYEYLGFMLHWARNGLVQPVSNERIKINEIMKDI